MLKQEDIVTKSVFINEKEYILQPGAEGITIEFFENHHKYGELGKNAENNFTLAEECIKTSLLSDHKKIFPNFLDQSLCESLITEFENDPVGIQDSRVLEAIIPQVLTEELDREIMSYFNSEYSIFWWSIYKVENSLEKKGYFTKWHCDGGPQKHLKVIIYLNGHDEHGSDTGFVDESTTNKLKDVGYIFNKLNNRALDLTELCQHFEIDFSPEFSKPNKGDCLVFNPAQLAHKAFVPKPGKTRYALNLCLVQSEANWRDVWKNYYEPAYGCQEFNGFADKALRFKSITNTPQNTVPKDYIEIALNNEISNLNHLQYLLSNIFSDAKIVNYIYQNFIQSDPHLVNCRSVFHFVNISKELLHGQLSVKAALNKTVIQGLMDLADFEETFKTSFGCYKPKDKPNPLAIFWPTPTHPKHPQSKYNVLPYVNKHAIMDIDTPIGSAGSCFAFEIAKFFQQEGYNYVVTERNDDPESGVLVDGYKPGDEYVKFCANYGILFNTPSFLQLAEKAFGIKKYQKLLIDSDNGYFLDPYRENVLFESQAAYMADYEKHVEAVKQSFLQSKIFVITLGLNECWQLHDGTFMSRNPRENMFHLVKHRTLTVQENVDNIQRFFDIIKVHNPDFKLIISVSPIPFLATGRANEQHIITANCHSKSVLRVAADELVRKNQDMYYLPSYELVTECVEDAWEADHRHVKPETVGKVVSMFQEIFVTAK